MINLEICISVLLELISDLRVLELMDKQLNCKFGIQQGKKDLGTSPIPTIKVINILILRGSGYRDCLRSYKFQIF